MVFSKQTILFGLIESSFGYMVNNINYEKTIIQTKSNSSLWKFIIMIDFIIKLKQL